MKKWRNEVKYRNYQFILGETPHAPMIESTCIFDGLYFIGDDFVGSYLIDTGAGLIMLDCGYDDDYFFDQVKTAFERFELSFSDLKYICISHGHFDHYGCAKRLKKLSNAKILMAKEEYELASDKDFQQYGTMDVRPDHFIQDNEVLSLGRVHLRFVFTPGHTQENTSFIFEVFDEGKVHKAELFSGCGITRFMDEEKIRMYIESLEKWRKITKEENCDVVLCMHPMQVNMRERIHMIQSINNKGIPNPFLVGEQGCRLFEDMLYHRGLKALKKRNEEKDHLVSIC